MFNTGKLTYLFRKIGLMHQVDYLKFLYQRHKHKKSNEFYKAANPYTIFPPDYMLFEAFNMNYIKYFEGGRATAMWVMDILQKHRKLENINFLDWGCGPARITRHLPKILDANSRVFGTDYNPTTIDWCIKNIEKVQFSLNQITPPLQYVAEQFDVVLGISIFTHLSAEKHDEWVKELHRIAKPNGVLMLTTHGVAYQIKLTDPEKNTFQQGNLIVRANVKEGHRVFAAFHPPIFMRALFEQYFVVLEHYEGKVVNWGIEQDYWVLKKKK